MVGIGEGGGTKVDIVEEETGEDGVYEVSWEFETGEKLGLVLRGEERSDKLKNC